MYFLTIYKNTSPQSIPEGFSMLEMTTICQKRKPSSANRWFKLMTFMWQLIWTMVRWPRSQLLGILCRKTMLPAPAERWMGVHSMGKWISNSQLDTGLKLYPRLIFDNITNPFISARAIATRSIVPGAIFNNALQLPNGPQSTFDLANGFLDLTSRLYVSISLFTCIYCQPSYC